MGSAQEPTTCATPDPSAIQHFEGSAASVTEPLTLEKGVYVVSATYVGESNFIIEAMDPEGNTDRVINEIDSFTGKGTLVLGQETRVIFSVNAEGPWAFDIEPAF
jgi:hypothetical protein